MKPYLNLDSAFLNHIKKYLYQYLYLLAGASFILWGRWDSIIYPFTLNPDEAQMAANILRMKAFGISWDVIDGASVGPYNSMILGWPFLFGADVTFSTVRITADILLTGVFFLVYYSIRTISGYFFAILFSLPLAFFYGLTDNYEFLHYSSETFPLFLLVLANTAAIIIYTKNTSTQKLYFLVTLAGITIGIAPFAKIQSVPIAIYLSIFVIFSLSRLARERRTASAILFTGSLLLPGFILLFPLLLNNTFNDFFTSYILWAFVYINKSLSLSALYSLASTENLFRAVIDSSIILFFISIIIYLLTHKKNNTKNRNIILHSLISVAISIYVIEKPGVMIMHYLTFLLPFIFLSIGFLCSPIKSNKKYKLYYLLLYISVAGVFLYSPTLDSFKIKKSYTSLFKNRLISHFKWHNDNLFSWLSPRESSSWLIWGWMPQWYLFGNNIPATHETETYTQIKHHRLTHYYRKRFMHDLALSPPDFVIDAVAGKSFFFNNPLTAGIATFPAFNTYIQNNFHKLLNPELKNTHCPVIYVRNNKYANLQKKWVKFSSITASATESTPVIPEGFPVQNINDFSVTEDTCIDYWLLPKGTLGSVSLTFTKTELVKEIIIINTGNGRRLSRASKNIKLSLYKDEKLVSTKKLTLFPHPKPNHYILPSPQFANKLVIEILSFNGLGGGLNEVKVIRAQ